MANAGTAKVRAPGYRLPVSAYDRVSSLLVALLILLGTLVFMLLVVWLTNTVFLRQAVVPVEMIELGEGDGRLGDGLELAGPLDEQIELEEPRAEETLASIADAVAEKLALLDDPNLGQKTGAGRGGDGRGIGRGDGSGTGVSRRWEVHFIKGNTLQTYARQLDFFGIELAVLLPDNQVLYASQLSQAKPRTRVGPAEKEKRYYLTWRSGELQEADRQLLRRAGAETQNRIILKFVPPELESRLAAMEKARADSVGKKARRTRFGVSPKGEGFAFSIIEQSYW